MSDDRLPPDLPGELSSTFVFISKCYPDGTPTESAVFLAALLQREAEMSIRNVSAVLGAINGCPAVDFLPTVDASTKINTLTDPGAAHVRQHLQKFGYDDWKATEDA